VWGLACRNSFIKCSYPSSIKNDFMKTDNQQPPVKHNDITKTTGGPQGVDKDPAEDPAGAPGTDNKVSLKGKKVDADLTEEKDHAIEIK
jgi:hypothetical protein